MFDKHYEEEEIEQALEEIPSLESLQDDVQFATLLYRLEDIKEALERSVFEVMRGENILVDVSDLCPDHVDWVIKQLRDKKKLPARLVEEGVLRLIGFDSSPEWEGGEPLTEVRRKQAQRRRVLSSLPEDRSNRG